MTANRVELQRCQFGVPSQDERQVADCGLPAVATWCWDGDLLYVCEEHDLEVEQSELDREELEEA